MRGLDRRATWLLVGASTVLLAVLAVWLVPWNWLPAGFAGSGQLHVPPAGRFFSAAQIVRAEDYARGARLLSLASLLTGIAVVALIGLTPLGSRLAGPLSRRLRWWLGVPLAVLGVLVAQSVATLPFALALRHRDLAAGLTDQGLAGWWRDRAFGLLVSWVIASLVVLVLIGLARRAPRHWPFWAGAALIALTFIGSFVYPLVVEPAFNRFTPVPDGPFRQSVLRLAQREGVHVDDVLVADASRRTTTLNAYVSGIGDSRRVVVYDNLMHGVPRAEVLSVVAHELGHAREHDVVLGTALSALGGVAGVGLLALVLDDARLQRRARTSGPADVRAVPTMLALFAVASVLVLPAQNAVSRSIEARADRAALVATRDPEAFRAIQKRLALRSLAEPSPPALLHLWFGTHPTVLQRMGLADAYAESHQ
jgi:STE24 endopeptidase